LTAIRTDKVSTLFITFWDRIARFGWNFIEMLCQDHHTTIIITDQSPAITSEEEFIQDFMALLAIFSGKLYKRRALKAKDALNGKISHGRRFGRRLSVRDSEELWLQQEVDHAIRRAENQIIRHTIIEVKNQFNQKSQTVVWVS